MKAPHIICLNLLLLFLVPAGDSIAQAKWGVRAGLNLANSTFTESGERVTNRENVVRMQAGLTVDVPVWNDLFVQPALIYQGKGFKGKNAWAPVRGNNSEFQANLSYITLPVNLLFRPRVGTSGRLLLGVGPYIGYGLGGRWKSDQELLYGDIAVAQTEGDVKFTDDGSIGNMGTYNYGKPWDYGVGFLIGYELSEQYYLQFNGDLGVANLQYKYGDYDPGFVLRNQAFGLSLGYKF